ncbi:MAG: fibronectin type III domain-containing protein, partial [Burkholderiaceae bacterium]
ASTVALSWSAVAGATGYHLYRDGVRVNATALTATSHTDSGLAAATSYSYAVSALNANGESAKSAAVSATTGSAFSCTATFASNYAHVQAGRAYVSGGYALALGSKQNMGLYNLFYTNTLAQTAPGYYIIGNCP